MLNYAVCGRDGRDGEFLFISGGWMFINYAYAADAATQGGAGSMLASIVPLILIFAVFWFLLIRPNQKKMKEHTAMLSALQKGEEVVTNGGIIGRIVKLDDSTLTLQIAENTEVLIQRGTISQLLPKGTIKDF
jgi:preprotein translocase subunit YajC